MGDEVEYEHHWHDETPPWAKHELEQIDRHLASLTRRAAANHRLLVAVNERIEAVTETLAALVKMFRRPVSGVVLFETEGGTMADLQIPDTDVSPKNASVAFVDAAGQPATLNDTPAWSSSDETVATVEAAADGLSAVVTPLGKEGATLIKADTVDADGTDVSASGTLTVIGGAATSGELTFS